MTVWIYKIGHIEMKGVIYKCHNFSTVNKKCVTPNSPIQNQLLADISNSNKAYSDFHKLIFAIISHDNYLRIIDMRCNLPLSTFL